jgi:hypothetical protein
MPELQNTNSSPSDGKLPPDVTPQQGTPNEDAASRRDATGEIQDPDKKRLHEEAASYRKRAQQAEAQLKTYQDAEEQKRLAALSDVERANKQVQDLQQKYEQTQKQLVAAHVKIAAQKLGIVDPSIAALAIADRLEFGEDGLPTNADKLLDELIKGGGIVVKTAETPATPNNMPRPPQTPPNNPGRSQIVSPGQQPQGRRPTLYDTDLWKK